MILPFFGLFVNNLRLFVVFSVICAVFLGNTDDLSAAFVDGAADAVQLLITLAGVICLWSGLMKAAECSGLTSLIAGLFKPLLKKLFPRLEGDSAAFGAISMNITANLLGLGNTATPFGLKAMEELHRADPSCDVATDEMVVFVVMNTASLQLLPTMLGSLRQSYGSREPFEILVPVWISSACALTVALVTAVGLNRLTGKEGRRLGWRSSCLLSRR